jgi:hypothetical protein
MKSIRSKRVGIRLSAEEQTALTSKAAAAGVTLSAFLRDHAGRRWVYNHADQQTMLRVIASLRQAASTLARSAQALKAADAAAALAYLAAVHRQLAELLTRIPTHAREVLPPRPRGG